MKGKEVFLKEDIVWAFDTFLGQLKSSETIHPQAMRAVERLKSQIVEIVPTHEVGSPWHTGTPTEEGWYLLHTKETIPYRVAYMRDNHWLSTSDSYIRTDIVIEWQKIKEKEET